MITIVDYGVGNFGSVRNMLRINGFACRAGSRKEEILDAEKIILPGVGSFDAAMQRLNEKDLGESIKTKAAAGTPILGICLGAQLLTQGSEEGILPGLGLLPATCKKFMISEIAPLKIPHMGWDEIEILHDHPVLRYTDLADRPRFYFAHSYHIVTSNPQIVLATCSYGQFFNSVLGSENIIAAQFHPEKSHKFGLRLLSNFARWNYGKS